MFASGELKGLIDDGLRGMTSNPTIFEKAFGAGSDYDAQLAEVAVKETDLQEIFETLAIDDIRHACDLFRPLFEETHGADGFVSLEVSPRIAHDTDGTIKAAKRLWEKVQRPNVMIKIPGTPECVPAIKEAIASGINVNVTLLFSVERYTAAATAYIEGLEARVARNEPVDKIASVASVFVSRIDSAVDKMLDEKIAHGEKLEGLLGKIGTANMKFVYQKFTELFHSERFEKIAAKGGHVQRPLWASTSTKNPKYYDLMYVESVVGPDTVNTVPPNTLEAILDHGNVKPNTVTEGLDEARKTASDLQAAGISLYDVTEKLVADGVKSFADSYDGMLEAIEKKARELKSPVGAKA